MSLHGGAYSRQYGFTLVEVLMALTVFSLIAVISYSVLATTGDGFKLLGEVKERQKNFIWLGRQLRSDLSYLSESHFKSPSGMIVDESFLSVVSDHRSDQAFDEITMLVREPDRSGVYQVRYALDESLGHLIRESRLLWAKNDIQPDSWDLGEADSWSVDILDESGNWHQNWQQQKGARAVRLRLSVADKKYEWLLPVQLGIAL